MHQSFQSPVKTFDHRSFNIIVLGDVVFNVLLLEKVLHSTTEKLTSLVGMNQFWMILRLNKNLSKSSYNFFGSLVFQWNGIGKFRQDVNHRQNILVVVVYWSLGQHLGKISFP